MLFKISTAFKRSFTGNLFVLLLLIYLLLYLYAHMSFYADPTSYFFNPSKAYARGYSAQMQIEASAFLLDKANAPFKRPTNETNPKLCVGIASISRKDADYLPFSAGSLLEGLTVEERGQIELKVLIAHTDPTNHASWDSSWLRNVADEVLSYEEPFANKTWMKEVEGKVEHESEKSLFDYAYLLSACKDSGSEYVLMVEDDTVAARSWYARSIESLAFIEQKMKDMRSVDRFLYLRLFYTEKFLGWNSESNSTYIFLAIVTIALPLTLFLVPHSSRPKPLQQPNTIFFLAFIYSPLLLTLFFLSGRPSVLPMPRGVHQMSKNACCSQALLFPSAVIPGIVDWLDWNREQKTGKLTDTLIEKYANVGGWTRWAVTPCVVQHVGKKSSKTGSNGGWDIKERQNPRARLWSFGFEREGRRIMRYGAGKG